MPKSTRVSRCVEKLKKEGDDKYNPYAVCQASTKQSYKTGKPLKKKGKKKMKSKTEALYNFINSLKKPENEAFIENVILKGFKVCFEALDPEEEKEYMKMPDEPEEYEEVERKMEEKKAAETVAELKAKEAKEITEKETM